MPQEIARSGVLAAKSVTDGLQLKQVLGCLIGEVIRGAIDYRRANSVCNIAGKILKIIEMQYRFGEKQKNGTHALSFTD